MLHVIVMSPQTSLGFDSFFRLFLVFVKVLKPLTLLRNTGKLYCWMSLDWNLSDVFLLVRLGSQTWRKKITEVKSNVQFQFSCSVLSDSATPWTAAGQVSLSITNSRNWLKLMSIQSVMPSNHLILCPLLLLPSIFPSIKVFSSESVLHIRWPKYWSLSFSISLSNEYSGLISFRIDWSDLLAAQGTLKSLLQHQSWRKKSINSLALSFLYSPTHIHTQLLEKPQL